MVAQGRTNIEITERTVKAPLTSLYEKTKTGNRLSRTMLINRGVT